MTAGLRWWHNVCKVVRENERIFAENGEPPDEERLNSWIEFVVSIKRLSPGAYQYLRTQWLAAYRKARKSA